MASASGELVPILNVGSARGGSTLLMALLGSSPSVAFDREYPFEVQYLTYLSHRALFLAGADVLDPPRATRPDDEQPASAVAGPTAAMTRLRTGSARVVRGVARRSRSWLRPRRVPALDSSFVVSVPPSLAAISQPRARLWRAGLEDPEHLYCSLLAHDWRLASEVIARGHVVTQGPDARASAYAEKVFWAQASLLDKALDVRVLIRVRDPRDVWASTVAFDRKRGYYGFGRRPGEEVDSYLRRWLVFQRSFLEWARDWPDDGRAMIVRYEDLVSDVAATSSVLAGMLDVQLDPEQARRTCDQFISEHQTSASPEASIGRFRYDLSGSERSHIEMELGDLMEHFGYRD